MIESAQRILECNELPYNGDPQLEARRVLIQLDPDPFAGSTQ
jgi:hypothetical protein